MSFLRVPAKILRYSVNKGSPCVLLMLRLRRLQMKLLKRRRMHSSAIAAFQHVSILSRSTKSGGRPKTFSRRFHLNCDAIAKKELNLLCEKIWRQVVQVRWSYGWWLTHHVDLLYNYLYLFITFQNA